MSLQNTVDSKKEKGQTWNSMKYLMRWLDDPKAPRYFALFGELGMGKTTAAKELHRRIWERHDRDNTKPIAIYLDLRSVGDAAKRDLDIDEIISRILKFDWKTGVRNTQLVPSDIYNLIGQDALIIFDGLDEVLVHLTPSQGQQFTRQLFRILPPIPVRKKPTAVVHGKNKKSGAESSEPPLPPARGRLLITCRTHYFGTFAEQCAHFTMEGREQFKGEHYDAMCLLPFGEEQIRTYLEHTFGKKEAKRSMEFFSAVHNLPELAKTPYTLSLIASQLHRLEQWKVERKPVTGLTLYRFVVEEWLLRDGGKHQITPRHKQRLMELVAAELTATGKRSWTTERLEDWLVKVIGATLADHYVGKDREILKEDFRTATFLLRDERDHFRFAHTSLQEYFLACYLRRALIDGRTDRWALEGVSPETIDFLGQSLLEQPSKEAIVGLERIRDAYKQHASELALRYYLVAHKKGYPVPAIAGFQLPGVDLRKIKIGDGVAGPLDMSNVNLSGAQLGKTTWNNCVFVNTNFSEASCGGTEWHDCDLSVANYTGTDLAGSIFRRCNLTKANFSNARTENAFWLLCKGSPAVAQRHWTNAPPNMQVRASDKRHCVRCCAWSPTSDAFASGSHDMTVRIWDLNTGNCIKTLEGHTGWVRSCDWSPDGRKIVSSSVDNTVRIWDVASGACLLSLNSASFLYFFSRWSPDGSEILAALNNGPVGLWNAATGTARALSRRQHADWIRGADWSSDGGRIVTASADKSLAIWETHSLDRLLQLEGHAGPVNSCAWSKDGRIVSGSTDKTLKIWDAATGDCYMTLHGHDDSVCSSVWSPDGTRILSASADRSLRIWDSITGACLHKFCGHSNQVLSCAWSNDGRYVLSASVDGTTRVWDVQSLHEVSPRTIHLITPSGEAAWASYNPSREAVMLHSNNAWRQVGAEGHQGSRTKVWIPAEAFTPMPS